MSRALAGLLVVCLFALAGCDGCESSRVDPNARVTIGGRVVDAHGALGGVPVTLRRRPDGGDVFAAIVSVGLVCLAPERSSKCSEHTHRTTTAKRGRFTLKLKGSDTQGTFGTADTLDLQAGGGGRGAPSTTLSFKVQHTALTVPTVRLWNAAVRATSRSGRVQARWRPLPPVYVTPGAGSDTDLVFLGDDGAPVWSVPHAASGQSIDGRLLEDQSTTAFVAVTTAQSRGDTRYDVAYDSAGVNVPAQFGAPDSRGDKCVTVARRRVARSVSPCGLTDGDLATPAPLARRQVAVDLGRPTKLSLLVVRACASCRLSIAGDDQRYHRVNATAIGDALVANVTDTARYVAIKSPDPLAATELSVWAAGHRPPQPSKSDAGAYDPTARDHHGGGHSLLLVALVAALAGAAGALAAVALVRARRRKR